ncbi:evolutionarily conserved signaling intermediate in Toll pathway, mitochondrial isoform X2 [Boleophthalmus pectinirostris]|uniref:evolutionarily conserved signaling intermediate in Toll pathway, mitochondrial isoform X2 n=1 Tax=Boleophthalmus pectinirostris TaxID=150288 RepID=UPI00242D6FAA|nr:evolutionarily conserved signaling intermediate in Toll pathway, mitochondrial isoform X2 [Boleophthalmus pectinirostris]
MKCARCLLQLQNLRGIGPSISVARVQPLQPSQPPTQLRHFHQSPVILESRPTAPVEFIEDKEKNKKPKVQDDLFERVAKKNKTKATFNRVVDVFTKQDVRRRGHVEFIYAALKKMPEFGVERDITVYNKLLDVFPKEVFVPRNFIQTMFNHYPRQQECGVQLLEQMENYGVMPNVETKVLLLQIFGPKGHPMRKYQRLMYWFPKFKYMNPYPVPFQLPEDPVDLAKFTLKRIADDLDATLTVYQMPFTDVTESGQEITLPHIVGIQSPSQIDLLAKHNPKRPVFVEGPFPLWLRKTCVYYYILRADPIPPEEKVEEPYDPERCFYYPLQLNLDLDRDLGDEENFDVEDLDEGPVFAMCMTNQGDQATLNQWISGLQETNPILGQIPTLFRLDSGSRELQVSPDSQPGPDQGHQDSNPETEERTAEEVEEEPQRRRSMNQ